MSTPDGAVRILDTDTAPFGDLGAIAPVHRAERGPCPVVVTVRGTVHLLAGATLLSVVRTQPGDRPAVSAPVDLPGLAQDPAALELSSVGERAVVLDREHRLLRTADGESLDPSRHGIAELATARLQQPGPAAGTVLLATADALHALPWDGTTPVRWSTGAAATPLAPVRARRGVCGAWVDPARVLWRGDTGIPRPLELTALPADAAPTLTAQGDLLLLDDRRTGWCCVLGDDPEALDLRPELDFLTAERT